MKKKTTNPRRLTLRGWAAIEDLRRNIDSSAEMGEWYVIPDLIFQTIELTVDKFDRNSFWMDTLELYQEAMRVNSPTKKFPILTSKEKGKEMPWEYSGRSWYFWLNLFASSYGWDAKTIGEMDIDDAIGLLQEVSIDGQMKKEWEYGLSELAYPYNPSTKKSHFKPLGRPDWMRGIVGKPKPVKERKIHRNAVPAGTIINLDEQGTDTVQ